MPKHEDIVLLKIYSCSKIVFSRPRIWACLSLYNFLIWEATGRLEENGKDRLWVLLWIINQTRTEAWENSNVTVPKKLKNINLNNQLKIPLGNRHGNICRLWTWNSKRPLFEEMGQDAFCCASNLKSTQNFKDCHCTNWSQLLIFSI